MMNILFMGGEKSKAVEHVLEKLFHKKQALELLEKLQFLSNAGRCFTLFFMLGSLLCSSLSVPSY